MQSIDNYKLRTTINENLTQWITPQKLTPELS